MNRRSFLSGASAAALATSAPLPVSKGVPVRFLKPASVGNYDVFMRLFLEQITGSMGMTYEEITGEFRRG